MLGDHLCGLSSTDFNLLGYTCSGTSVSFNTCQSLICAHDNLGICLINKDNTSSLNIQLLLTG